jgi:transposase
MKSEKTSGETAPHPVQDLLGTSKSNPLFRVCRNRGRNEILLYYGMELLETFLDCPDHFAMRLCAGRLYNAGIKKRDIEQAFGMDIRTIARIANAMKEADPDRLFQILQGRQRARKLTPEIVSFLREMVETALSLHPRSPSRYLRELVQRVYGVSLCAETIRPFLAEGRKQAGSSPEQNTQTSCDPFEKPMEESEGNSVPQTPSEEDVSNEEALEEPREAPEADRKRSACFASRPRFLPHAGLRLFTPMLNALAEVDRHEGPLLRQLAAGVLLGAANLERTKLLDSSCLSFLLGPLRWTSPPALRKQLHRLAAEPGLREALLRFNARMTGHERPEYVYFDPHTKAYTGEHPVLYGWVASKKHVGKAIHGDWFHGPDGFPLWHRLEDNYEDLRTRFLPACRDLRREVGIPEDHPLCVVVDRGIYGLDALEVIGEEPGLSVLTWDPVSAEGEEPSLGTQVESFDLVRNRNDSEDRILTRIEAWESPHCRVPGARRIVFRTGDDESTPPKSVAVLEVGGGGLGSRDIVERMTGRWVQENDFKYQIEHFGLHELTSYTVVSYEEIAESLADREVPNALRNALVEQTRELKKELGKLLVSVRMDRQKLEREMARLEAFNQALQQAETTGEHVELHRKATACVNAFEKIHTRVRTKQDRAEGVDNTLASLRKQIRKLPETVSRLQTLIEKGNVRHRLEAKLFFDTLKLIARNMFCLRLREFRRHYDNLRDDHVILRALTHAAGTQAGEETLLHPGVLTSQRKLERIFSNFLKALSEETSPHSIEGTLKMIPAEHAFESAMQICDPGP